MILESGYEISMRGRRSHMLKPRFKYGSMKNDD
jgi:hypothetical protein